MTDSHLTNTAELHVSQPTNTKEAWKLVPEYAPQVAILVAWPHLNTDWVDNIEAARLNFADLIGAISLAVMPWVLIPHEEAKAEVESYVKASLEQYNRHQQFDIEFSVCDYDDTWTRDYGPLTVFKASEQIGQMHLRLQNFIFNGWGDKHKADLDNLVNQTLWNNGEFARVYISKLDQEKLFSVQIQEQPFVLEGGSLETNGETLMTTTACLLNQNRNPSQSQSQIEQMLRRQFGTTDTIWLHHGHLEGDDTDAHVDTLSRFINKNTIIFQGCHDEKDSHYKALQAMKNELLAASEKYDLKLIELPWPKAAYDEGRRLPATYANFLVVNNHILLPTYDCSADATAIHILEENFPNMVIVPVPCSTLIRHNGSLHCSTMQLPQIWTQV